MANTADADFNAGTDLTQTKCKGLRNDVLSTSTGHRHSGAADGGKALFGTPVTRSASTVYTAATDIIVTVLAIPTGADPYIEIYVDAATNPPTTLWAAQGAETSDTNYVSITVAIPKEYLWKVMAGDVTMQRITEVGIGA